MAETQTQPAEQPQLPLADPGQQQTSPDEALEPTTITLDGEDGAAPEPEKTQPSEEEVVVDSSPTLPDGQKPRKHVPSRQRIGQLTARAKTAEERAAALEAENQRLKQAGQQLYMQNQQNELQAMTQYGESLKAKLASAKQRMTEARNSGDVNAEGEAIAEIGKLSADQSSVEAYLARNNRQQQRPQAPQQQRPEQRPQQQEVQVTDEVKSWMKENSWYDRSSPDFDPEMNQFAFAESMKLDARYRRLGKENLIGSAAYLQEIDKAVRSEFPDEFESDGREQPPLRMEGKGPQSAVASSNAAQGIRRVGNETRVQLTSEERAFARQMQLKHEYGPKAGQPFTDQEKEVAYAKNKVALKNGKPPGGVEINMKIRG